MQVEREKEMHRGFAIIYDQPPKRDTIAETCEQILYGELLMFYDAQLQDMTSYTIRIVESRKDPDTLRMLHDGTLPMPINHRLPIGVLYFKACFQADPSKEIELLIGRFGTFPLICALGMHNGQEWVYTPLSIRPAMKRAI